MPLRPYSQVQKCLTLGFQPDFLDLSTSKILKLYRRFGSWSFVGRRGRDRDEGGTDSR